eukprot:1943024-Ditylum_brightwellii.AAC.1
MVMGKQMKICWHVDDLKILHFDSREVKKMLKVLENKYGKMKTTCGKVHDYLGTTLDCRKRGKVKVCMVKYTEEVVETFPEKIEGSVTTPATDHLFERARQDIQTAVAFLTPRVKELDKDDWKKL